MIILNFFKYIFKNWIQLLILTILVVHVGVDLYEHGVLNFNVYEAHSHTMTFLEETYAQLRRLI